MDPILGIFAGFMVLVFCGQACLYAHAAVKQPNKGTSVAMSMAAGAVGCGAVVLLLASGPGAPAIAVGFAWLCCVRMWCKSRQRRNAMEVQDEHVRPSSAGEHRLQAVHAGAGLPCLTTVALQATPVEATDLAGYASAVVVDVLPPPLMTEYEP
eukprot:SAG31_NODE_5213_length_2673_cov_2.142191_3_plen_154_part_00